MTFKERIKADREQASAALLGARMFINALSESQRRPCEISGCACTGACRPEWFESSIPVLRAIDEAMEKLEGPL